LEPEVTVVPSRAVRPLAALVAVLTFAPRASAQPVVPGFTVETWATVAGPEQLAFDAAGNLYTGRGLPST
jgi:hypothetical protein